MKLRKLCSLILILFSSCKHEEKIPEPTPPNNSGSNKFDFDSFVARNLSSHLLARDPPACGSWRVFLRGVVKAESNWNPKAVYEEKFIDGQTKKRALSVGLFQLSIGDRLNYKTPYCQKITEETLFSEEINTGCALEIMDTLSKKGRSLGDYWSVIRNKKVKCE